MKIALQSILLFLAASLNAQVWLSQDFETSVFPPEEWSIDDNAGLSLELTTFENYWASGLPFCYTETHPYGLTLFRKLCNFFVNYLSGY